MNVFTTILPGLRDLRAPLASGYLWLVAAWLALADKVPNQNSAQGIWVNIYRLGEAVGRPGLLAASAFTAYLVGILTENLALAVTRPISGIRYRFWSGYWPNTIVEEAVLDALFERYQESKDFREALASHVQARVLLRYGQKNREFRRYLGRLGGTPLREPNTRASEIKKNLAKLVVRTRPDPVRGSAPNRSGNGNGAPSVQEKMAQLLVTQLNSAFYLSLDGEIDSVLTDEVRWEILAWAQRTEYRLRDLLASALSIELYVGSAMTDLNLIPARLVGTPVFERWDRLRAESEFRLSIVPPLLTLTALFSLRLNPLCWLFCLPCVYLLNQGIRTKEAAAAQLAESVRVKHVNSPPLERVKSGEPQWRDQPSFPARKQ